MNAIYFFVFETRPEHFPYYNVTWRSLLQNAGDITRALVVGDGGAAPALMAQIPKQFEIREVTMAKGEWWLPIALTRWNVSAEGNDSDNVLFLDSRDILIQRDPFEDIIGLNAVASGEGVNHSGSRWNSNDRVTFAANVFPQLRAESQDWPVVCFGLAAGKRSHVRAAMLSTWLMTSMACRGGTDQGAWNYLWNKHLKFEPQNWICDPNVSDWCLSGHHAEDIKPAPRMENGKIICAATGRPYAIVHQWDRTRWAPEILKTWS